MQKELISRLTFKRWLKKGQITITPDGKYVLTSDGVKYEVVKEGRKYRIIQPQSDTISQ